MTNGELKASMPSFLTEEEEDSLIVSPKDILVSVPEDYEPEVLPWTDQKLTIEVHKERANEVLTTLLSAYENNAPPYNQDRVRLPHDPRHMPETLERGSVQHAMFLFNICYYMRGGIKSNDAVKRMSKVFDAHPSAL